METLQKTRKIRNCLNCGAPLTGCVCEYCDTRYPVAELAFDVYDEPEKPKKAAENVNPYDLIEMQEKRAIVYCISCGQTVHTYQYWRGELGSVSFDLTIDFYYLCPACGRKYSLSVNLNEDVCNNKILFNSIRTFACENAAYNTPNPKVQARLTAARKIRKDGR